MTAVWTQTWRSQLTRVVVVAAQLAGCGGEPPPPAAAPAAPTVEPPAVCSLQLPEHLHHAEANALPPQQWFRLLIKGYSPSGNLSPGAVDCTGAAIHWPEESADCLQAQSERGRPATKLSADHLVLRHAEGEYWYAWILTRALVNQMWEGPFAVVRVAGDHLEARAIGTLRSFASSPAFEVRNMGGQHLLVAQGGRCARDGNTRCQRGTRLMWLDRQHFHPRPLRSVGVQHSCLGPAWFPEREVVRVNLDPPWYRELERTMEVSFEEDRIVVNETIAVEDHDASQPDLPAKLFRKVQAELSVTVEDGELMTTGQSLWNTVREQDGSSKDD